jgi:hypothetical protein
VDTGKAILRDYIKATLASSNWAPKAAHRPRA